MLMLLITDTYLLLVEVAESFLAPPFIDAVSNKGKPRR